MYDHVIDKNIFPTFICSCIPQIDMMSVMEECYMIKNQYDPVESSNEGGYHSPRFQEEDKFFLALKLRFYNHVEFLFLK